MVQKYRAAPGKVGSLLARPLHPGPVLVLEYRGGIKARLVAQDEGGAPSTASVDPREVQCRIGVSFLYGLLISGGSDGPPDFMSNPAMGGVHCRPPSPILPSMPVSLARTIAAAVMLWTITLHAHGQHYKIGAVPQWVQQHDPGLGRISDTACIASGVEYMLVDRQYNLAEQAKYFKQVIRLTSVDGVQQNSRFTVDLDPGFQRITLHTLRVVRNGKPLERLLPAKIKTVQQERDMDAYLYNGAITVYSDLEDVRIGDLVEFSYTVTGWDPTDDGRFHQQVNLAFSVPVGYLYTRFIIPAGRDLSTRLIAGATEPLTRETGSGKELIWEAKDLSCVVVDDGAPAWYEGYPGVELSEFRNVDELRAWGNRLFNVDMDPGDELEARIAEFKRLADPKVRMDSALSLVQRKVRYLGFEQGIGAYRPHAPKKVFLQRFGDCKDKSLLLVCILRACGIDADPALVNSSAGARLNGQLPRPGMFDHCIVKATANGSIYWLDPTLSNNGGNMDERHTPEYGYALVLGDHSGGLEPMHVHNTGTVNIYESVTLDKLGGSAEIIAKVQYGGRFADAMRNTFSGSSMADMERNYQDYYSKIYGPCTVLSPLATEYDAGTNVFTTHEHYQVQQAWDTLADGSTLGFSILASGVRDYMVLPTSATRNAPLQMGAPFELEESITVTLPETWNITPYAHQYNGYGVRYSSEIQDIGTIAKFTYTYNLDSSYVPTKDYIAFHGQQDKINDDLVYQFTWNPGAALPKSSGRMVSWAVVACLCILAIMGAFLLYRWDPASHVAASPVHYGIDGFLVLPAIGISLSPLLRLFQMFTNDGVFFRLPWLLYTAYPHKALGVISYGLFAQWFNISMLVFSVVLAVLFFKRRTSAPFLFKMFYFSAVAGLFLDFYFYHKLELESLSGMPYPMKDLMQAVVGALIWIPVFHFSDKVKHTFVVRRKGNRNRPLTQEQPVTGNPGVPPDVAPAGTVATPSPTITPPERDGL
jgi:transglutaminase-like putative cysteine protease